MSRFLATSDNQRLKPHGTPENAALHTVFLDLNITV